MKAFQIADVKDFMKKTLLQDTFDPFRVSEVSITTAVTYAIDGILHPEFYSSDEANALPNDGETYISWKEVKPFCFFIIKGKKTPLNFKIVFLLSRENVQKLLDMNGITIGFEDVSGLYLNCQYEKDTLMCVTGTSLRFFTMDKSLDHAWDDMVTKFFKQQGIAFEEM